MQPHLDAAVSHRDAELALELDALSAQLDHERVLVHRLEEPGAELAMDCDGCTDHRAGDLFVLERHDARTDDATASGLTGPRLDRSVKVWGASTSALPADAPPRAAEALAAARAAPQPFLPFRPSSAALSLAPRSRTW
jgi:hypothetical protein